MFSSVERSRYTIEETFTALAVPASLNTALWTKAKNNNTE
jgi:hypothetical protein